MEERLLGTSGLRVSRLGLGTMTWSRDTDEHEAAEQLRDFVDAGGTLIDTAASYADGASEELLGSLLSTAVGRDEVLLCTKAGVRRTVRGGVVDASRGELLDSLDASLRRLGVEHIDLYQMHAWDAVTPLEETLRFLDDAVRSGKIAYYGFSNYLGWQLTKAVHVARAYGFTPPVTLQPQYSLLVREIESEIVPACLDANIGLLPWSPLAGGWLTGKYQRDADPTGATRLGEDPERGMEAW